MVEMEGGQSSNPPPPPQQFSDMFQKFAMAFRAKTYDLFADDDSEAEEEDVDFLLDSAEEFIPDQKVVVMKPVSGEASFFGALIPSLFATAAAFEAAYLQFQAAHVPRVDRKAVVQADESIVSLLEKFNQMRKLCKDPSQDFDFPANSYLKFEVQENQSKLRVLETMVNSLQSQIDAMDDEVRSQKNKLDQIRVSNQQLSQKLGITTTESNSNPNLNNLLTIRVFEAALADSVKTLRRLTKLLIDLMKKADWDVEEVSTFVHPGISYLKTGHFRYAFLSYVALGMFQNFDRKDFGLPDGDDNGYWHQLVQHISTNPIEILQKSPTCAFSRFCQAKYESLIHPTMESSIFVSLDMKDKVLDSWRSLTVFFEAFVRMASSVWLLHKLAHAFDPAVEIFRVEKGRQFSMVYMEDVLGRSRKRRSDGGKPRIGFTVVPGFKVGRTVIQSQVYLSNSED